MGVGADETCTYYMVSGIYPAIYITRITFSDKLDPFSISNYYSITEQSVLIPIMCYDPFSTYPNRHDVSRMELMEKS